MKYILITGGAGFIGFNLANKLLEDNNNYIYIIDNFITGTNKIYKSRIEYYNCDITDYNKLKRYFDITMIDEIYHLASIASPPKYLKYPLKTMDTNIIGTKNILELIKDRNIKLLFTSTSEVYGEPMIHPQHENYYGNVNTVGLRSCYDESKRCAETYIYNYKNIYNKDYKIARLFNTYGPGMDIDDGRVITSFIKSILDNKPVIINGSGLQTRSFCYIDDLVTGLIDFMQSNYCGPMNLGNNNTELNLLELKDIFSKICNININCEFKELMLNDPLIRKPDLTMANELINFNPVISLEEGLTRTIEYFIKKNKRYTYILYEHARIYFKNSSN